MVATTAATIAEDEMAEDSNVVTTEVMTEGTIEEEIAVAIGIVRSAITTISHSATSATVARLSAQAVVEIPVAVTAEATEAATSETIVAVTDAIIAEETVEEIAEETVEGIAAGIGIALSARTTTSHSVTNATAAKQIVLVEVAPVVEVTEAVHATAEIEVGTAVVATVAVTAVATQEVMTVEVQDPQIHEMAAAGEGLLEAIADRADQDSEAQVVAASVATDRAEAAVDVESAPPQHSSHLLVSSAYGAKRGDALDRCA